MESSISEETAMDKPELSGKQTQTRHFRPVTLCLMCQNLFMRPSEPIDKHLRLLLQGKRRHRFSKHCNHCTALQNHHRRASDLPWLSLHSKDQDGTEWEFTYYRLDDSIEEAMRYMPVSGSDGLPAMGLDPSLDGLGRTSIRLYPNIASTKTNDKTCFEQMREWMSTCILEHKICRQQNKTALPPFLPTRLIDVTGTPRLVISSAYACKGMPMSYTTVSHRWGQAEMPKLLNSNIDEFKRRIHLDHLTPTFRDAITVTRQLGLHFVWIDALCIIQDDTEDWITEAARMGLVYQNASCNLGAIAAAAYTERSDQGLFYSDGLFQSRNPASFALLKVRILRAGLDRQYWAYHSTELPSVMNSELMGRGWVYQERLLSPCSIYFDKQLVWECSELIANEVFPQGAPYEARLVDPDVRLPVLLASPESFDSENVYLQNTYSTWLLLIRFYSPSELTYRSDVFAAFSGVARCFNTILQDEYVAGIWRKDLINGLLWHRMGYYGRQNGWRDRSQDHAPSWSWASAQGAVQYYPLIAKFPQQDRVLVAIHEVHVTHATSDQMGAVKDGFIRMSGNLRPNQDHHALAETGRHHFIDAYDQGYTEGARNCEGTFFLAITYRERYGRKSVQGLILEPTGRAPGEYERIGAFTFDPEVRSEFRGFDPDILDLQTIVLV